MNGYQAYQLYLAVKLHFTSDSYDVFKANGKTRVSYDSFMKRNDKYLFEKLASKFNSAPQYIQFIASNFMYGCHNVIYEDYNMTSSNYKEYIKRKQSITRIFEDDLSKIDNLNSHQDIGFNVFQLYLTNIIKLESVVIFDTLENIVDNQNNPMVEDIMKLISKSRGFVKFDPSNIVRVYCNFLKEIRSNE